MKALILAGGTGTRLWPISRSRYPKQFVKLLGEKSFFQQTVSRLLSYEHLDGLFVLTHPDFFHEVQKQLEEVAPHLENAILLEPDRKNTAPAVTHALSSLLERNLVSEQDTFFIGPSDHLITPETALYKAFDSAQKEADLGKIVTFGVRPTRPETGFGYIHVSEGKVQGFVEKPQLEEAKKYLLSGEYFWNSGMFVTSLQTYRQELECCTPEIASLFSGASFSSVPSLSLDYALMEKTEKLSMIPLDLMWSDVGSWEDLYSVQPKDPSGNVVTGEASLIETTGSFIHSSSRLVTAIGLKDMVLVETEDAVLVAPRARVQEIKTLVAHLHERDKPQIDEHLMVKRPWGSYTVLGEGGRYKIKRIEVQPLQKLSLQMHYHRSEHWVVVKGTARVTIDENEHVVHEGESIFVPKSSKHRIENPGKVVLEIIEVQVGEYVGEDDIERFEDVYGRVDSLDKILIT